MTTVPVALSGCITVGLLLRSARRSEVTRRLREEESPGGRRVPGRAVMQRVLDRVEVDVPAEDAVVWIVTALIMVGFVGLVSSPVVALGVMLVALGALPVVLRSVDTRRHRRMVVAIPTFLREVADGLRAGGTVTTEVHSAVSGTGPVAVSLARVVDETRLGASFVDALSRWATRLGSPEARAVAGALSIAAVIGGPGAGALDGLASSLEDRRAVGAEARALSTQARLSAWVVGLAPVVFLVFTVLSDSSALHVLTMTTPGRVCLAVGLALEFLAVAWIRHIVGSGVA